MSDFDLHRAKVLKDIEPLRFLLESGIPSETTAAERVTRETERWYSRLTDMEAETKSLIADMRLTFLAEHPKRDGQPDLDRRAAVDVAIRDAQELHDKILGYRKAIEQRVSFVQSLLKTRSLEWRVSGIPKS